MRATEALWFLPLFGCIIFSLVLIAVFPNTNKEEAYLKVLNNSGVSVEVLIDDGSYRATCDNNSSVSFLVPIGEHKFLAKDSSGYCWGPWKTHVMKSDGAVVWILPKNNPSGGKG